MGIIDPTQWPPLLWLAAIAGAAYGLHLIGAYILRPMWRVTVAVNRFTEALPVLLTIAEEFKPNGGSTLRDQVDKTNIRLGNIEQQLEALCGERDRT